MERVWVQIRKVVTFSQNSEKADFGKVHFDDIPFKYLQWLLISVSLYINLVLTRPYACVGISLI